MSYYVSQGNAASVPHVCRDLAGAAVTGQAAALQSSASLWDETGAASAVSVTVAEVGSGLYSVAFTPDAAGNWRVQVTNPAPATADGATHEYFVQVAAAGVDPGASKDLTTRSRVKRRIWPDQDPTTANTDHDDLIDYLITEVSYLIHDKVGRCLVETSYTEFYDGNGYRDLQLRQGPIASVTSVEYVDESGTVTSTLAATDYSIRGKRSNGAKLRGRLRMRSSSWSYGVENIKIVYTAGFATVPELLAMAATERVVAEWWQRNLKGFDQSITEGSTSSQFPLSPAELNSMTEVAIQSYVDFGAVHA